MPKKGYKQTEEHKQKLRLAKLKNPVRYYLGKKRDEETKKKISETLKKNPVRYWKNKKFSKKHKINLSKSHRGARLWSRAEKSPNWKGDKVGYNGLHTWVRKNLGTPKLCKFCKITNAKCYEWANKSGKYKRNINDWIRLCKSCHIDYDKNRKCIIAKNRNNF